MVLVSTVSLARALLWMVGCAVSGDGGGEGGSVEAIDLVDRQLEAYAEFSRYANGLTVTDRQLMPPPPPWLPSTGTSGDTRERADMSHGPGSSRKGAHACVLQ